jgi:hypothetical protein
MIEHNMTASKIFHTIVWMGEGRLFVAPAEAFESK